MPGCDPGMIMDCGGSLIKRGAKMARVLMVLAVFLIFHGCGQKTVTPSGTSQQNTTPRAAGIVKLTFDDGPVARNTPVIFLRKDAPLDGNTRSIRRPAQIRGEGNLLRRRKTGPKVSGVGTQRIQRRTLCTEPLLHPSQLHQAQQSSGSTRTSHDQPSHHGSRRSQSEQISSSSRMDQRQSS